MTVFMPCDLAKSTSKLSKPSTLTLPSSQTASFAISMRFSCANIGCLLSLFATATMTLSKIFVALMITSKWPFVMGSNVPG